ncbi:MAG TPA: XdhC family protein [Candidatus Limnocylindria bacterium]|nr:XdhC family protein [Candidatus Limnocylindria bacterium]
MKELLPTIRTWRGEGVGFGRAVLLRAFGPAPRPAGATLLVADDGRLAGSVSGGCVEGACVEEVLRARRNGEARVVRFGISDEQAWDVGLACGSTIDVLIQPELRPELEAAAGGPGGEVVVTPLPANSPGPRDGAHEPASALPAAPVADLPQPLRVVAAEALAAGRSVVAESEGEQYFIEVFPVPPRLVVFGAVQEAMPLVRFARELDWRVAVVDARSAFATRERFPQANELLVGWPDEVAGSLRLEASDSVAVLSHDPKLDEPAIVAAIRAGCRYVGAIGSRRTQARRRERLRAAGLSEEEISGVRGPIGLALGGREPAEVALAIMAEVLAARHGASAAPLSGAAAGAR